MISRGEDRPNAVWLPIHLRESLPTISIPLAGNDPAVPLDLMAIVHRLYDDYGFKKYMYKTQPVPPLTPADAVWAREILAKLGVEV